jgi:hypothetical protein
MSKKIIGLIGCILIFIVVIRTLYPSLKHISFNKIINNENYTECYLTKYNPEIESVLITSNKDIENIFNYLSDKEVRKIIIKKEIEFKTYYSIFTKENWILIYDNKYIELLVEGDTKWFEFINPIDPAALGKYFEE